MRALKPLHIGLITAGLMIAASLFAFYSLKLPVESNFQFIVYAIFTIGVLWSIFSYHKKETSSKKFKDYFSTGFKTFVIVALLMAVFAYIFFSFNTAFRDAKIEENNKLIIAEGNHLPREIEENAKQLKQLFMPIMVSSAMFRYLIIGALISLAGAGFLSRNTAGDKN
jgi:cbb3-type cytochrome oxidase subunit 3